MNRLAAETSPYLRQHADNPVHWYAWGDEAFAAAKLLDKPILLSVGYSSCHWCHVMAHESFEDAEVAGLMNDLFVNVKVDREERPDVDEIYMEAVQALTGQGGWPMTVFLTPDGRPFFAGTYFPRTPHGRMIAFPDLCQRIGELWRTRRQDIDTQAGQLTGALGRTALVDPADTPPGADALASAVTTLRQQHDDTRGGFGGPPKFPQAMSLDLLLRQLARPSAGAPEASPDIRAMVETSLDAMAAGGIYDHVGGGFARYSVDAVWLVPHFEKMLYDQALLVRAYLHAWQATGHDRYRQVLDETVGYVLRDLRHPEGAFYSAEDADSEGEEGRFYLWTPDEIVAALDGDRGLAEEAMAFYGVTPGGNFEGSSILHRMHALGDLARPPGIEEARARLFAAREHRVRPGLDDKVLAEWNGLMLSALAEAAAATGRRDWLDAAARTGEFLLRSLRRADGRWLRSWQADGGARHLAYAADHAALVDAFVRLAEATGRARWIEAARGTADALVDLFWDDTRGGVFTTGTDAERLVTRNKDLMDNATPSANSLAAVGLLRLAALTGEGRYRERAEEILRLAGGLAAQHPTAFGYLLVAVDLAAGGLDEVVVAGERPDLVEAAQRRFLPAAVLAWGERYPSPLWEGREDGR
ncbi:MAG TPA: thioredoxin domain-containing protein, partial [Acidimicrobiales bacterium]|nr:thioredoxin domain-containing protein [Acidimicrobiales bacterium]